MECKWMYQIYRPLPVFGSFFKSYRREIKHIHFAIATLKKWGQAAIKEIKTLNMATVHLMEGISPLIPIANDLAKVALNIFTQRPTHLRGARGMPKPFLAASEEASTSDSSFDELNLSDEESFQNETEKAQFLPTPPCNADFQSIFHFVSPYISAIDLGNLLLTSSSSYENMDIWATVGKRLSLFFDARDPFVSTKMQILLKIFGAEFSAKALGKIKPPYATNSSLLLEWISKYTPTDSIFFPHLVKQLSLPFKSEEEDLKDKIINFFKFFEVVQPEDPSFQSDIYLKSEFTAQEESVVEALEAYPEPFWHMRTGSCQDCYHFYYRDADACDEAIVIENDINIKCVFSARRVESEKIINDTRYRRLKAQ